MDCPDTFSDLMALWGREEGQEAPQGIDEHDDPSDEPLEPDELVGLPPASHEAIKRAAQRWDDFVAVTRGHDQEAVTQAGYTFAAALGLEGHKLTHAVEFLKAWTNNESPSEGTMGLLFGLLIAEEAKLELELEGPELG